jgi:hypothetical protein
MWRQPKAVWAVAFATVVTFLGIGLVNPILKPIAENLKASPSRVTAVHHGKPGLDQHGRRVGAQIHRDRAPASFRDRASDPSGGDGGVNGRPVGEGEPVDPFSRCVERRPRVTRQTGSRADACIPAVGAVVT